MNIRNAGDQMLSHNILIKVRKLAVFMFFFLILCVNTKLKIQRTNNFAARKKRAIRQTSVCARHVTFERNSQHFARRASRHK